MADVTTIEIIEEIVKGDPDLKIYRVSITDKTGEWKEVFGSEELLNHFMKGVKAGYSMQGLSIDIHEIKRKE